MPDCGRGLLLPFLKLPADPLNTARADEDLRGVAWGRRSTPSWHGKRCGEKRQATCPGLSFYNRNGVASLAVGTTGRRQHGNDGNNNRGALKRSGHETAGRNLCASAQINHPTTFAIGAMTRWSPARTTPPTRDNHRTTRTCIRGGCGRRQHGPWNTAGFNPAPCDSSNAVSLKPSTRLSDNPITSTAASAF